RPDAKSRNPIPSACRVRREVSNLGRCLAAKKEYDEALDTQWQAIALNPKCWQVLRELRSIPLQLHQLEKAHIPWRKWLGKGPLAREPGGGSAEWSRFWRDGAESRRAR